MAIKCPKCNADNPDTKQFCGDCGTRLPTSGGTSSSHTKTLLTPTMDPIKGTTFAGRYQLIEELGKGGVGIVYKAQHYPRALTATAITCLAAFLYLMSLFACSGNPSAPDQPSGESGQQQCLARAVFGNPADSEYILPYPVGASYPLLQTYCGPQNHRDDNQLAYDFTIPFGDPVIAARAGIVRRVTEHFADNDTNRANHNHIYIEHSDGTTAFYAHLVQDSVLPEVGDWVAQGELIAQSGTSGGTVAVLHFGVYRTWPAQGGDDVAINFRNTDGPIDERGGLVQGATYTALPY